MYSKVVVPLDGSKLAECVLPQLQNIANECELKDITFLRVVTPPQEVVLGSPLPSIKIADIKAAQLAEAESYLSGVAAKVRFPGAHIETKVLTGNASSQIADFAEKEAADLIVIATHGRSGIKRLILGSVADQVVHLSCVPVLMVRATDCIPYA